MGFLVPLFCPFHLLYVAQSPNPPVFILLLLFFNLLRPLFSPRFDLILDNVGGETEHWAPSLLQPWGGSKYITLVTPFLRNTDALGIADGMVKTAASLAASVFKVIFIQLMLVTQPTMQWVIFYLCCVEKVNCTC